MRAGALIVSFNLPFDISRIAVRWAAARNGGFSFVLSQLSKRRIENHHRPRIRIAPLNGVAEKIELTAVRRKDEQHRWRRGRFLDLHTLAFALTDNSYSLSGAIDAFDSKPTKMEHEPSGKITDQEISYARQDVRATLGLLNALKHEYELHPIRLAPHRAYSPASIGKAYVRAMGIVEPMLKFKNIPHRIHGIAMATYYGGRAECRIRRWPVPVVPVDLTSEYPSVDALLGIWDVLTAAGLTTKDFTTSGAKTPEKYHVGCSVQTGVVETAEILCANHTVGRHSAGSIHLRQQIWNLQHRIKRTSLEATDVGCGT